MPRRIEKKARGVFEREPGSDIWWIRYKIDGIERREKVGAVAWRRDPSFTPFARPMHCEAVKLPKNMKSKGSPVQSYRPRGRYLVRKPRSQGCAQFQKQNEPDP